MEFDELLALVQELHAQVIQLKARVDDLEHTVLKQEGYISNLQARGDVFELRYNTLLQHIKLIVTGEEQYQNLG